MSTLENGNLRKVLLQNQENMDSKLAERAKYISGQFYYNCFCHLGGEKSQRRKISVQLYGSCEFFIYLIHNLF